MNIYAMIAVVVGAVSVVAGAGYDGYKHGHKNGANAVQVQWDSAKAEQIAEAQKEVNAVQARLTQASADLEKARNEKEIVYRNITRTVTKLVDRPVYRNVCLDDDGLRNINAALAGTAADPAADPGKSASAVPAADAAGGNDGR
jgi:hypothetical protein